MSFVGNRFHGALDRLFPKRQLVLMLGPRAILSADPVRVIDIGGAMGADERWGLLRDQCRFMFFEPDTRSQGGLGEGAGRDVVLPIGLAGADGERTLHLTKGPFASSLYRPNEAVLKSFAVWPWYRPAGDVPVNVRTLDGILAEHDGWTPDFFKVDVEGADLEVLQGGQGGLAASYGLQIEMSFLDRNEGAPSYGEVDQWLRTSGFVPHLLIREHWVRQNGLWGANSNAQIAWGDAVYFRPQSWVLARMAVNQTRAGRDLSAFVAILLAYGCHDAALDLIKAAHEAKLVPADITKDLERSVRRSVVGISMYLLRGMSATIVALVFAALAWPLGGRFRRAGSTILRRQASPFFYALSAMLSRGGLNGSCITDRT